MLVASNTSPVSNLAIIGRLDLLRLQFGEIWIPGSVQAELDQLAHPSAVAAIKQAIRDGWIKPRALHSGQIARLLATNLDSGEAEAIALALELSADLVLLDEKDGRSVAAHAGLRVRRIGRTATSEAPGADPVGEAGVGQAAQ